MLVFVQMTDFEMLKLLVGVDPAPFLRLIHQYADATQQETAEVTFSVLKDKWPGALVVKLIDVIDNGNDSVIKHLALTLLHKVTSVFMQWR